MLTIRKEQLVVLQTAAERSFLERLAGHCRKFHASAVDRANFEDLQQFLRSTVGRARNYGLTWESSITAFVALTLEIGQNFDRQPRIQTILTDEAVSPNERIDVLIQDVSREEWEEAARC